MILVNSLHLSETSKISVAGEDFLIFLQKFYELKNIGGIRNKAGIQNACLRMEQVHKGQKRKNKKPYHIHPYTVARIYCMIHGGNISETGVIAAILHDNIEIAKKSNIEETFETVQENFGHEDAIICIALSKKDLEDKTERNTEYFERFSTHATLKGYIESLIREKQLQFSSDEIRAITIRTAIIKICDRIHNLGTMHEYASYKIREKIEETQKYLLPLAKEISKTHPKLLQYLEKSILQAEKDYIRNEAKKTID